jgi:hypothetical protein
MNWFSFFMGVLTGYLLMWLVVRIYEAYKQWEEQG